MSALRSLRLWLLVAVSATLIMSVPEVAWYVGGMLILLTAASVLTTIGLLRAMHNYLLHHASHGDFGRISAIVGDLAGATAATHSLADYRSDHQRHHAGLTDQDDPDQQSVTSPSAWSSAASSASRHSVPGCSPCEAAGS